MPKTEWVAHNEIAASTTIAYRIGSRWYWVTEVEEPMASGSRFVMTVPVAKDPRYAQMGQGKLRYIGSTTTVLMRAQTAPVWDWVTTKLENIERMRAYKRGEIELTGDEYVALSNRIGFGFQV